MNDDVSTLGQILDSADAMLRAGSAAGARVWPTGFEPLDTYLGGGLRSGHLTLLGGSQGLGKTTMALQMLRNVVARGGRGVYFSFEHDGDVLLERFLAIEAAEAAGVEAVSLRTIRETLERPDGGDRGMAATLGGMPGGAEAVQAVSAYGDRLVVHRSNSATTSSAVIGDRIAELAAQGDVPLIVVDYLQKVAVPGVEASESERVTLVVEALKDLSLEHRVPILAIVASDREGITAGKRLRIQHLRGSTALAYEADVVLLMNDKFDVVARHHLVYDVAGADRFHGYVVVSIEKNRTGLDRIDLEFRKQFDRGRFDPHGGTVSEQLVDERVFVE